MGLAGPLVVEVAKIVDYLLSTTHPIGRSKAAFFMALGFAPNDPIQLMDALEAHARARDVVRQVETGHGTKYEIRCRLTSPSGRDVCIVAIWIEPRGISSRRFVTAYPAPT